MSQAASYHEATRLRPFSDETRDPFCFSIPPSWVGIVEAGSAPHGTGHHAGDDPSQRLSRQRKGRPLPQVGDAPSLSREPERRPHADVSRVSGLDRSRRLSPRRMAVGRRRLYRDEGEPVHPSRLPRLLRHLVLHQGRQARKGRGRSVPTVLGREALHALPRLGRGGQSSRPSEVSPSPHGRARREQVGTHHLGRGVRRDLQERPQHLGHARARGHPHLPRNRPRHHLAKPHARAHRLQNAEPQPGAQRLVVLHAPARGRHRSFGRLRAGRCGHRPPEALRGRDVEASRGHRGVGQRAPGIQRRRLPGPLACLLRAHGVESHLRRPAPDLVGRTRRLLPAAAPRHRRRPGVRLAAGGHLRRPGGPRVHQLLVRRL